MGNYKLVAIDAINERNLQILIPIIIGAAIGLIAFSHILSWVFKRYRNETISILTGFILGSVSILWPWQNAVHLMDDAGDIILKKGKPIVEQYEKFIPEILNTEVVIAFGIALIGIISIALIEKLAAVKD